MTNKRKIKSTNKTLTYNYNGQAKAEEVVLLDNSVAGAYSLALESFGKLEDFDESTSEFFEAIFSDTSSKTINAIKKHYSSIKSRIEGELTIVRGRTFFDKSGNKAESVSASAMRDKEQIYVYDRFFENLEEDEKRLNDRASVILHEVGHLIGLLEDTETESTQSAECLRNFTLLICGLAQPEELLPTEEPEDETEEVSTEEEETSEESEEKLEGENGELPQNDNHYEAGTEGGKGGQFAPLNYNGGTGGSGGTKSDENKKEIKKNKKIKDANVKESEKNENLENNEDYDYKGLINLHDGGVKIDGTGNWAAANLTLCLLELKKRYTVVIENEYTYPFKNTGRYVTETAKYAIDAISNEFGEIDIYRAGILGEYNKETEEEKEKKSDKEKHINKRNKYQQGNITIKTKVSVVIGSVLDNYGKPDTPANTSDIENDSNQAMRDKYGLGYYGVFHSADAKWLNTPVPSDYNGGGINGRTDPNGLKEILSGTIEYNYKTKKTTISGDFENTAPGRNR